MKNDHTTVSNIHQAVRFVEGMETFDSKAHLIRELDDDRFHGKKHIQAVLAYIDSNLAVQQLLIPLLRNVINEETMRPVNRRMRLRVLLGIYHCPNFLDTLDELDSASRLDESSAELLCRFLLEISKANVEV